MDRGQPDPRVRRMLADATARPFWLDGAGAAGPFAALAGSTETDLLVVGGGFTGLWAAIQAKQDDPGREVVLVDGGLLAHGASGRNGGFADSSLTHGLPNGLERFPRELARLEQLGRENLDAILATVEHHGIDARVEATGQLTVATRPHEVPGLDAAAGQLEAYGHEVVRLDRDAVRAEVASPTYLGGVWQRTGTVLLDPARLAWGLGRLAVGLGVRVLERTPVTALAPAASGVRARTVAGTIDARRVVLATSAFTPLLGAIRRRVAPVWDYVLVTEPLSGAQREAIGWRGRQGLTDSGNRFHYYRLTPDDRLLWGGYEAVYRFGNDVSPRHVADPVVFGLLARNLLATFPQLDGIRVTHAWGGAIDTCSRFCATFGTGLRGRVAYAVGFTGLGVAASRFGARVALDLADGRDSELTRLELVRTQPLPFPPEPLRWLGISLTRHALAREDATGRRGAWLRLLDRAGLGFDS